MSLTKDEFQQKKTEQDEFEERQKELIKCVVNEVIRILKENKGLYFTALELMERIPQMYLKKDWKKRWGPIEEGMLAGLLIEMSKVSHVERLGDTWYFSYKKEG